jgi:hypothetical protein
MKPGIRHRVIEKRNFHGSIEMSFFGWSMGIFQATFGNKRRIPWEEPS